MWRFLFATIIFIPTIPPHSEEIDSGVARNIAMNVQKNYERTNTLGEYKKVHAVKMYIFSSIYANASRGKMSTTIAHPAIAKLSYWCCDQLNQDLIGLGYEVDFDLLNPTIIRVSWGDDESVSD
jgi:hypothetical protein